MKRMYVSVMCALLAAAVLAPGGALSQSLGGSTGVAPDFAFADRERIKVSGIESGSAWLYEPGADGTFRPGPRLAYWRFDENGNALENTTFDRDGSVILRLVEIYDDSGRLAEAQSDGKLAIRDFRTQFSYDAAGRLVESASYRPDGGVIVRSRYRYDSEGKMLEMLAENEDGGLVTRSVFTYDANGNVARTLVYDAAGALVSTGACRYDGAGRMIEQTSSVAAVAAAGSTTSNYYDAQGNLARIVVQNADGVTLQETENTFAADGAIIETVTENAAVGTRARQVFRYDARRNLLEADTYNKLDQLVSRIGFVYEYFDAKEQPEPEKE